MSAYTISTDQTRIVLHARQLRADYIRSFFARFTRH